jgi:gliding motility-associated-like protein
MYKTMRPNARSIIFTFILFLLLSNNHLFGQDSTCNNYTGTWLDDASWVDGSSPGLSVNNNDLDIYGYILLNGDFDFNNGLLTIHDTLIVNGDFALLNNGDLSIDADGILIILGDYISYNQVQVSSGGYFIATGNFEMQGSDNQGFFENSGAVYIFDDTPQIKTGSGYTDLQCNDTSDYPANCGYGNEGDIVNDPIYDFFNQTQCITTDTDAPSIVLPLVTTVQCSANVPAPYASYADLVAAGGSASDDCAIDNASFAFISDESDGNSCPEIILRAYTINDMAGNAGTATQSITVHDTTSPILTLPAIAAVQCIGDIPSSYASFAEMAAAGGNASDNCSINQLSFALINETSVPSGNAIIVNRTYKIMDNCNNQVSASQDIRVEDDTPPVITCPSDTIQCANTDEGAVIDSVGLVSFADNCSLPGDLGIQYTITGATAKSGMNDASGNLFNNGLSTVEYTVTDEGGNAAVCSFHVTINPIPLTSDITGDQVPVCEVTNGIYSVSSTPGSKYSWTVPINASIVSDTSGLEKNSIVVDFGRVSGYMTVRETNVYGCSGDTKSLYIDLQDCELAYDFEADRYEICLGDSFHVWSTSSGISPTATFQWDFGVTAIPISASGPGPHTVRYSTSGMKTITLNITDGTSNLISKNVEVMEQPEINLTASDRCGEGNIVLTALAIHANSVDFSTDGGLSIVSSDSISPYEFTYFLNENDSVMVWARALNKHAGCTGEWSGGVEITALQSPVTSEIHANSPQKPGNYGSFLDIACQNEIRSYSVDPVDGSTYHWLIPSMNIDTQGIVTIDIGWNLLQGEYSISLQEISSRNCPGSVREETVFISDPFIDLGPDREICDKENYLFNPSGDFSFYTWQEGSHGSSYTGKRTETIWVRVENEFGCEASDTAELIVNPLPSLKLGNDTMVCDDNGYEIMVPGFVNYYWSTGENTKSIVVHSGDGEISLTVTDSNACSATDTIVIQECTADKLFIAITNTFTPNGDGIHDRWIINNIELFPDAVIDVYDRNGRLVYHADGYKNDWDGTSGGKPLPVDSYFYVIDFHSDQMQPAKGTVTIIR